MLLASAAAQRYGVDEAQAAIRFGEAAKATGAWAGRRLLWLGSEPAFELSFWCGTCPILFQRLEGANRTLSLAEVQDKLAGGLAGIDPDIVAAFAALLPAAHYLVMLLQITPRLTYPVLDGDYFAHEQVATWGIDGFWGLPENPRTPYYRTFETAIAEDAHLYEFVVPMVPPSWNDRDLVEHYSRLLQEGPAPTVVAVSTLDICQPAMHGQSSDYYEHWALTHFLLDGHHKIEAAAACGRPVQLLSLVSVDASLAGERQVARLPSVRARRVSRRSRSVRSQP
ncbi:hypothetical protein [Actinopolymorpha pittospori]